MADAFDIVTEPYKIVEGHPIQVDVLVPKLITSGVHPVIVRLHGGWLFAGVRNAWEWYQTYTLEHAAYNNAIVINPDYRLLPEAKAVDSVRDINIDLWEWILNQFPAVLAKFKPGVKGYLTKILAQGTSAGGFLAIHFALAHPAAPDLSSPGVTALLLSYPMLDFKSPYFAQGPPSTHFVFGERPPISILNDHLQRLKSDPSTPKVVTEGGAVGSRTAMAVAATLAGRYLDFFGQEEELYVLERLQQGRAGKLPTRVFIYHGNGDSAIPVEGSRRFVEVIKSVKMDTEVMYHEEEGGDHGFELPSDNDVTLENTPWLKEGLEWLEVAWLSDKKAS